MSKQYLEGMELLEVNGEKVGSHITWLLRNAIATTVNKKEEVNSIVFNDDCPKDTWGLFHSPARSIIVNIQQHLGAVMDQMQDVKFMNTSIKVILIHELLDTVFHEAHHAKMCAAKKSWEHNELDEEQAVMYAAKESWECAEYLDVNVDDFGEEINTLLAELYKEWEEDVSKVDCKAWKRIQYHMISNGINYYNPDKGLEIVSIREVFEAQVQPATDWVPTDDESFCNFQNITVAPPINSPAKTIQTPVETVAVQPIQPVQPAQHAAAMPEDYNPLDDISNMLITEEEEYTPPTAAPQAVNQNTANTSQTVNQNTVNIQQPVNPPMDVQRIQNIAEQVIRRMFHHVFTKCEFNTAGGFNNVNAVLEPVSIADIDGATELFTKQDTLNEQGAFVSHVPTNGMIKGLPTESGLPRYTFYLNIGGNLHKRVFIAQNPLKKNNLGKPTAWAKKVMTGGKIMMLVADNIGITAHAELEANQLLGQEKFVIWSNKK